MDKEQIELLEDKMSQSSAKHDSSYVIDVVNDFIHQAIKQREEEIVEKLNRATHIIKKAKGRCEVIIRSADGPAITEGYLMGDLNDLDDLLASIKEETVEQEEERIVIERTLMDEEGNITALDIYDNRKKQSVFLETKERH